MTASPVADAYNNLSALAAAGTDPKVGPAYLAGLVRVRPDGSNRGSFIEGVATLSATRPLLTEKLKWTEIDHAELPKGATIPVASYFRATVPEGMTGRTGMVTFGSLSAEQRAQVKLVDGNHGPELVMA